MHPQKPEKNTIDNNFPLLIINLGRIIKSLIRQKKNLKTLAKSILGPLKSDSHLPKKFLFTSMKAFENDENDKILS